MIKKLKQKKRKGFTLVELVVVIAILAILALIMVPNYKTYIDKSRDARIQNDLRTVYSAAEVLIDDSDGIKLSDAVGKEVIFNESIKSLVNFSSEKDDEQCYDRYEFLNEQNQLVIKYEDVNGKKHYYPKEIGMVGDGDNGEEPAINTDPVDWYRYDESSATITGLSSLGEANVGQELSLPNKTPEGKIVTAIGANAFNDIGLKSVTIPNSVVSIGEWAFMRNELTSLVIPDSVEYIGAESFRENQLAEITIPSSVTVIQSAAFNDNRLPEDKAFIYARDTSGNVNTTKIVSYGGEKNSVAIPDFVKIIGQEAFSGTQLSFVDFSDATSLTEIEEAAFASNHLTSVDLSSNKNPRLDLGKGVFYGNQLNEVVIPTSIASIGEQAFAWDGDSPSLPTTKPEEYGWAGLWKYDADASEWKSENQQSDTGPPSGGGGGSVGSPN